MICEQPRNPARKLWTRTRNRRTCLPNPQKLLRKGDSWLPVYEALRPHWIDRGCAPTAPAEEGPAARVARPIGRSAAAGDAGE